MKFENRKVFIKKEIYTCFLGIFFSFCSIRGILDLQTSINIQEGLGSTCGFVMYGITIFCSLTIVPSILERFGPKISLVIGEFTYLVFVLSNFYPVYATMIPASIFSGFGEALVFPAISMYNVYYAKEYSLISKRNGMHHYLHHFVGICYGVVYATRVCGDLISFAVLQSEFNENGSNNSTPLNSSIHSLDDQSFRFCGANDCQNPNLTKENLSRYIASKPTTYTLLGIFSALIVMAILVHWFAVEAIKPVRDATKDENKKSLKLVELNRETEEFFSNDDMEVVKTVYDEKDVATKEGRFLARLLKNLQQLLNPKQLLLAPLTLYVGIHVVFVIAEISRAYFSCIMSVKQAGLGMAVFGFVGSLSSSINGVLSSHYGPNFSLFSSFLLDMTTYIVCLLWQPNAYTMWLPFAIAASMGYSSGVWQSITNAIYADYFPENQEIAFATWNTLFSVGMATQYGWSTYLCVRSKIYGLMTILCTGVCLYGIAEVKYNRKVKATSAQSAG